MDKLVGVLQMILPVGVMLFVGTLCRKKNLVGRESIAGIKALVVNVFLPAVLIKAFLTAHYSLAMIVIAAAMFAVCGAALALGFALKKAVHTPLSTAPFLMTGFEAGMLGYALYTLLFGTDAVSDFATVDLGQVLFVFTVFFSLLRRSETGGSLKASLKDMATSPVIISIVVGVVVGATGLGAVITDSAAGGVVLGLLDFVAAPTAAVILFVVGFELEFRRANMKLCAAVVLTRLLVMAALGALVVLGVGALFELSNTLKWAFVLMFLLPPPFVLPIFTKSGDENAFVSAALSLSTALTLAAFAVIAYLIA